MVKNIPIKFNLSKGAVAAIIIAAVIIIDQIIKLYVKTHFYWGEDHEILPFFHLRFIQNPGMAFGMELGSKLFLSVFRVVVVGFLIWLLIKIRNNPKYPMGFIVCMAMIIAGAAGNIIDCLFYGEIFNNPYPPEIAHFVPWGEGYAGFFHGMVVDMFYFPLFSFTWPDWMPFVGGNLFTFFDPVFNFADASITVGMIILIFWYSKYINFSNKADENKSENTSKA